MTTRERQVLEELTAACEAVVNNWEHGDLAHAANLCDEAAAFGRTLLDEKGPMMLTAQVNVGPGGTLPRPMIRVEFDRCLLEGDDNGQIREPVRRTMRVLALILADSSVHSVYFDDECPQCEGRLADGKCPNVNCRSHAQEDEP